MKNRIRELRKLLGLNQTEFGRKLGLTQKPISDMEQSGSITERNFEAICREWHVNPEWLRHGVGEIFVEQKESVLQMLVHEFDLTPDEKSLVAAFLELPPEYRAGVIEYVKEAATAFEAQETAKAQSRKPDDQLTKEEAMELVGREWDEKVSAQKRGALTSSASISSSGSCSKRFSGSP